jgi:hypothetical protein
MADTTSRVIDPAEAGVSPRQYNQAPRGSLEPQARMSYLGPNTPTRMEGDSEIANLRNSIELLQLRAEQAEQTLQDDRRRRSRASAVSMLSTGSVMAYARPKLATPWVFKGKYSVMINVLNWISTVTKYLDQCRADPEDWSGYARTYMDPVVQAWMDAIFYTTASPPWEELVEELKSRYLPDGHALQVELKFGATIQTHTLRAYVEQFQLMEAALILARVDMSNNRKVSQFAKGLARERDRYEVLHSNPQNLKDCYQVVSQIRQAHILTSHSGQPKQNHNEPKAKAAKPKQDHDKSQAKAVEAGGVKQFHSLAHQILAKYPDKPTKLACLRCGSKNHLLLLCPKAKQEWADAFSGFVHALVRERCGSRGGRRRQRKNYSEDDSEESEKTSVDSEDSRSASSQEEEKYAESDSDLES